MTRLLRFDEIGRWSEVKLDTVRRYAVEYSRIMTSQGFRHLYVDAFAGAGAHPSRATGGFVTGGPPVGHAVRHGPTPTFPRRRDTGAHRRARGGLTFSPSP
jgi:hypothetical protein